MITQIALIDIVFSIDSVITAVGMANEIWIMITAVVLAMIVLMVASGPVAKFVDNHPTVKILALGFLIMIGMALMADSFGFHVPKGYIYSAMLFSIFIEFDEHALSKARRTASSQRLPAAPAAAREWQ